MNDDGMAWAENLPESDLTNTGTDVPVNMRTPGIPVYLEETYWWAYLHPNAIRIFEREWLVNLILMGNMRRLTQAVLEEIGNQKQSSALQVACVYGDFSSRLATHLGQCDGRLHLLDIAPIQLRNARRKLSKHKNIRLHHQDSSELKFTDKRFENTVVFFLLHEQPADVRSKTIAEAIRVTQPGGKVVFVDYHRPTRTNPLRYLMHPVLKWLEPFALDLWQSELHSYLPPHITPGQVKTQSYFGGLYQKLVVTC